MSNINVKAGQVVRFEYRGNRGVTQREVTVERIYMNGPTADRLVGKDATRNGQYRSFLFSYIATEPVVVS